MMLKFLMQVRDLKHGYISFTQDEKEVIDHPLFQRLRHIRQADVANYVYPSSNITRFEHALGTCHVAGAMAQNFLLSDDWKGYREDLEKETGIDKDDQFVRLARLYALLHDIGHLPLSHLFERALETYAEVSETPMGEVIRDWFNESDFEKPHEAFGARLARRILADVQFKETSEAVRGALLTLMTRKTLERTSTLSPVKHLVDSTIDADRIDFVARDGMLAGGEYGNYDIRRLTSSVFLHRGDDGAWYVMYAERALNSIEALLFDRYRTYTWINFHHRVVTVKLLTRFLIQKLIERRTITPEHFAAKDNEELMLRNDVWLWNLLQELDPQGDREAALAKRALLSRRKNLTLSLWRNRLGYEAALDGMREKLPVPRWREFRIPGDIPEEEYGRFLTERMKTKAFVFYTAFNPIGSEPVWLYNVRDMKPVGKHLLEASELLSNLRDIWLREPQFYVQLLKDPISRDEESKWLKQWSIATADWFLPRWR